MAFFASGRWSVIHAIRCSLRYSTVLILSPLRRRRTQGAVPPAQCASQTCQPVPDRQRALPARGGRELLHHSVVHDRVDDTLLTLLERDARILGDAVTN